MKEVTFMLFLGLVLTFPVCTALTAKTMGGRSKLIDGVDIQDPTLRAMGEMLRDEQSKAREAPDTPIITPTMSDTNCPDTPLTPTKSELNAPESPHTLVASTPSEPITSTSQTAWR